MDVLGNSQKRIPICLKSFLERLIKLLIHGKKEYGPTLHCYVVVLIKKKKEKARGILTVFIIANLYTVLCSDIFEIPLGSTFCNVQYLSSTHQFHLCRSADHIKKVHSGSEFILRPWLEQLESFFCPISFGGPLDSTLVNSFEVLISGRWYLKALFATCQMFDLRGWLMSLFLWLMELFTSDIYLILFFYLMDGESIFIWKLKKTLVTFTELEG